MLKMLNGSAMQQVDVVAVTDDAVKSPGALVWWRLGGTILYSALMEAWQAAGLEESLLGDACGPRKALRRAVDSQREKHRLRRRLPSGGWAIIAERADAERNDLNFRTEAKVSLDELGRLDIEPADHPLANEIRAEYDAALERVTAEDVSSLLCDLIAFCGGVSLREGGGLYFVAPRRLPEWEVMVRVLRSVSGHLIYSAPAMRSADVAAAVLAGMEEEAATAAAKMEEALANDEKERGARWLRNRAAVCEQTLEKITGYEQLLGGRLDAVRERMEALRANIAGAILAAETDEEV